ncbi:hypothetical protein EPN52_07930 [bacterium]|nr:MAG: hypothetical protein EPN52_07930 [bacterium]
MPEYYHAVNGEVEDDGLNINDDTPLYILALTHHVRATGDVEWLASMYESVRAAADYIVSQVDERGLVFCSAKDPRGGVWAIASWRNIIPSYTVNGAVTEINAECVAALREVAHLATELERGDDSARFAAFAERIAGAMNTYLINPENGLYYLNIDADGNVHTDVTGDEIFPVMFRICDEETGFRVISRLNAPDFWTSGGLRTASRNDPCYDPSNYSGLLGGVWPGLTWWYAFAAARYHPAFMVRALRSSFEHYAADSKKNSTVPGQFSEWFDGESLTNKGMRLSPWEPPRFLWAVVEGVCGLTLTHGLPCISPLIPEHWTWVGLRRIPYHGGEFSYAAVRQRGGFHIYSTVPVQSESEVHVLEEDVSDQIAIFAEAGVAVALRSKEQAVVLLGNVGLTTANVAMNMAPLLDATSVYRLRVYDSERQDWEEFGKSQGCELAGLAFSVETQGFRLLEFTRSI